MNYQMQAAEATGSVGVEVVTNSSYHQYRFPRSGQRPLMFEGKELAMAMSYTPELPYWYEFNVFETSGGSFALVIKLFYQSELEEDRVNSWTFETLPEVFDALEAYDAASDINFCMPQTESMAAAELAAKALELHSLIASQRAHFASLLGEMLEELETAA